MNVLLISLILCCTDIKELILDLGSDDPEVREKTSQTFKSLGDKVLIDLENNLNNPDPEIKRKVRSLYNKILSDKIAYAKGQNTYPEIWYLDAKIRYPNGVTIIPHTKKLWMKSVCKTIVQKDIAKEYYELAIKSRSEVLEKCGWENQKIGEHATELWLRDQVRRFNKDELKTLLEIARKNQSKNILYFQIDDIINDPAPNHPWYSLPPGPLRKK